MSAQVLREAASLLRSRAENATPGPWRVASTYNPDDCWANLDDVIEVTAADGFAATPSLDHRPNAEHIAGTHPGFALAVADLLDAEAELAESTQQEPWPLMTIAARAVLDADSRRPADTDTRSGP